MPRPRALLAALALVGALALAACAPGSLDPTPTSDATPTQAPPPSDAPEDPNPSAFEPAPSVAPSVGPAAGDLDLACDALLTPQQVYDFNPQMLATASPTSALPEAFAAIVDAGGVVCAWEHVTSADVLLVGVAPADGPSVDGSGCAPLTCIDDAADDLLVRVGSRYFEGAEDQGADVAALVVANLA
ncbi:hypothetical protein GCM10009846_20300 [Agrococcus versicolor]|uniref:DUF3558 domain-containing protein n=1 Tax=Agrococcus versicolor TaxID=501482 RepID=A0ABP5MND9_9MICO